MNYIVLVSSRSIMELVCGEDPRDMVIDYGSVGGVVGLVFRL